MKKLPIVSYATALPKILIGIDNYHLIVNQNTYENANGPVVAQTKLGWIVYGPTKLENGICGHIKTVGACTEKHYNENLHQVVKEYFTTENFGVKTPGRILESDDDARANKILNETTVRLGNRFQTGLLWKSDDVELQKSKEMALGRLKGVESKMSKNTEYFANYEKKFNGICDKRLCPKTNDIPRGN